MEVDLEEDCLKALALHQPVAIDLRFIIAILKINNDLERIGDLTVNIAEHADHLATHQPIDIPFDFADMADRAQYRAYRRPCYQHCRRYNLHARRRHHPP